MFGYAINAILIFMTHPGMLIPFNEPGYLSASIQVLLVLLLNTPADRAPNLARATEIVYYVIFFVWAFIKARIAMWSSVAGAILSKSGPGARLGR